ncbi:hypothetical protein A5630_19430 [Mycolicibacterium mucogenicum]|uniref:Uncharacterized protein n=1 Tax=Mycolicibacterium mucogenicum TaxID=56689 RepID=A0A1A3H562_MYCMU|nr:hypothetical protein A5630_19430 [Mycolicibacterium mucogenicum]
MAPGIAHFEDNGVLGLGQFDYISSCKGDFMCRMVLIAHFEKDVRQCPVMAGRRLGSEVAKILRTKGRDQSARRHQGVAAADR